LLKDVYIYIYTSYKSDAYKRLACIKSKEIIHQLDM
jgi:hypothetical protein